MAKQVTVRKPRVMLDCERAMHWYNMGLIDREIAEKCGVGRKAVTDWRTRTCLPPNATIHVKKVSMTLLDWDAAQARKHGVTYGEWKSPAFEAERDRLLKKAGMKMAV